MAFKAASVCIMAAAYVLAVPAPAISPYTYNQAATVNSAAASSAASIAGIPVSNLPGASLPVPPVVYDTASLTVSSYHGPYTGPSPTITGANTNSPASSMPPATPLPPLSEGLYPNYNPNGTLNRQMPLPYQPAGGVGTAGEEPVYIVKSDFDYQSILLGLYQEWIELDLFNYIYQTFSEQDFIDAGLAASERYLVEFMALQEVGHATLLSNMLGGPGGATPQCTYNYPFKTLHEAFDFTQKLTRYGESGVYGFLPHLDSREVANLLTQSIATEGRQQMIMRQFSGLFPMPIWFEIGVPQSWAWTLLAPYISSCPASAKRLSWQNFPQLTILNQPNTSRRNASATGTNETEGFGPIAPSRDAASADSCIGNNEEGYDCSPAISQNRSIPLSYPGKTVYLQWENPGQPVGPNNSYVTSTTVTAPKFVLWVSQLNATYSPLTNITSRDGLNFGQTIEPFGYTYAGDPLVNGTMFIALTDTDLFYTPFNLSLVNPHVAAMNIYQAG